ncbi:cupin domain-containing protein [uncultured Salinisphaera sp.]|uniref:cupin domain-containing protein n=1 Tax=uncultured Salinisphaera sp. TaxID=359372 RepID=UPI0032B1B9CD|tara:strand:+ start:1658 stop:2002 length:345 start_codon:yes stop_codon:yes gene_type:complete
MNQSPQTLAIPDAGPRDGPGWAALREGVQIFVLQPGYEQTPRMALLDYLPGAWVPWHRHTGDEHIYVLQGSQQDENGRYTAGSYVYNPAGSAHSVASPEGCRVLIQWFAPVAFE